MADVVDTYCVRCDSSIGWDPEQPDFCSVCWDDRQRLPLAVVEAIETLAIMVLHSPSYQRTVQPFADAHQQACRILERLQGLGVAAASKTPGEYRESALRSRGPGA